MFSSLTILSTLLKSLIEVHVCRGSRYVLNIFIWSFINDSFISLHLCSFPPNREESLEYFDLLVLNEHQECDYPNCLWYLLNYNHYNDDNHDDKSDNTNNCPHQQTSDTLIGDNWNNINNA